MLVSVVIPAYNCAEYIGDALESVLAQSYQTIEVIVVDDGSTDATSAIVRTFPRVVCIQQANGGPAKARNVGVRRASGAYIAFQDADDLWLPEKLAWQMAILESDPEIGLVFGDMRNFDDVRHDEPTMFEKYRLGESYFGDPRLVVEAVEKLLQMNFIPTGTVLARKEALISVGLFDETFRCAEDWDLWLRVALNYRIGYTRNLVMKRRLHPDNTSRETEAMTVAALQVLEKLKNRECAAEVGAAVNIVAHLQEGYRNLGYFYLRELSLQKARRALIRSLSFGVERRALLYFASTFLGPAIVKSLLRARG